MLRFFDIDKTTLILETNKIVEINNAEKLEEGVTVVVKFGKDEFEANVVKLHGKSSNIILCYETINFSIGLLMK